MVKLAGATPRKIIKLWGPSADTAFRAISDGLFQRGFDGPLTWEEGTSVPYVRDTAESIRVILSISKCGGALGFSLFDSVVTVWSKTIFTNTISSDPWFSLRAAHDPLTEGYVPCLVTRLSHQKWAQQPGASNPSWFLTMEDIQGANVAGWFDDFDLLQLPFVIGLNTDAALDQALSAAIAYERPSWVKSDGPRFVHIQERLLALRRGRLA